PSCVRLGSISHFSALGALLLFSRIDVTRCRLSARSDWVYDLGKMCVSLSRQFLTLLILLTVLAIGLAQDIWKDPSQPLSARVNDLVGRMTLQEKIGQMINEAPAIPPGRSRG